MSKKGDGELDQISCVIPSSAGLSLKLATAGPARRGEDSRWRRGA